MEGITANGWLFKAIGRLTKGEIVGLSDQKPGDFLIDPSAYRRIGRNKPVNLRIMRSKISAPQ